MYAYIFIYILSNGIAFLRADRNRINNRRQRVFRLQPPLMIMKMEDVCFFDSPMDKPDFCRISHIGPENWRCRISIYPGAHRYVLPGVCRIMCQRHPVAHRFRAVADCRSGGRQPCSMIHRRISILIQNFQLIMEKYGIFPKSWFSRLINVCHQSAFYLFSCLGMKPRCLRRLYNNCTKQSVDVGRILTASRIRHIMEQKNTFRICIPGVPDFFFCCAVRIKSCAGAVRGLVFTS